MGPPSLYGPLVSCVGSAGFCSGDAGTSSTQRWPGCLGSENPPPLLRYCARVMTWTSLTCSDGRSPGRALARARSSGLAELLKAMRRPSGDQTGAPAPRGSEVMGHGSPPAKLSSQICGDGGGAPGVAD